MTAIADVVILSKAENEYYREMTQAAIDSCLRGALGQVNIYVVEQVRQVHYRNAITIRVTEPFNYNRNANLGAKAGSSNWIVFANNDLLFEEGWLGHLLAAEHPVVSPVDPGRNSQAQVADNLLGTENGLHFSGWCFMMKRSVWEDIGLLDEDFIFWCADDSVIEQLKMVDITPMVVPRARVKHLTSKTIGRHGGREDNGQMTWAMVHKFEQKYGPHRLRTDPRYHRWQRKFLT